MGDGLGRGGGGGNRVRETGLGKQRLGKQGLGRKGSSLGKKGLGEGEKREDEETLFPNTHPIRSYL